MMEFWNLYDYWHTTAGTAQVGHCTVAQCAAGASIPRTVSSDNLCNSFSSAYPLPIQVALDDEDVKTATQLSITESQRHQNQCDRISKQNESDFQRAMSESKLYNAVLESNEFDSNEEEECLLKSSSTQSLMDEQRRWQRAEKQYEEELKLAMELSIHETSKPTDAEDDLQRALVESRDLAEAEKATKQNESDFQRAMSESKLYNAVLESNEFDSNEEEECLLKSSSTQSLMDEQRRWQRAEKQYEEELKLAMELSIHETSKPTDAEDDLQRALVESRDLAEAEKATYSIEKALAESISLEETRKFYLHEQEKLAASCGVDLLEEVKQLSLKQHQEDVMLEEKGSLREAIEESKHVR